MPQFELISLPKLFVDIYLQYCQYNTPCAVCNLPPVHPAICLLCGVMNGSWKNNEWDLSRHSYVALPTAAMIPMDAENVQRIVQAVVVAALVCSFS